MGIGARIANFVGLALFGEPVSPIQFPGENWTLSQPRIEKDAHGHTLTLTVRDLRYPRLRGTVTIRILSEHTHVRWRTRASGGGMAAHRLVRVSDDGYLCAPMLLGALRCSAEELKQIGRFLERQVRPDRDEADPLLVTVPVGPIRPRGGLSAEARPEE